MATFPQFQQREDQLRAAAVDPVAQAVTQTARAAANSRDLGAGTGRAGLPNPTFRRNPQAPAQVGAAAQIARDLNSSPAMPNTTFQRNPQAPAQVDAAAQIARDLTTSPAMPNETFYRVPNAGAQIGAAAQIARDIQPPPQLPMGSGGPAEFTATQGSAGMPNPTFARINTPVAPAGSGVDSPAVRAAGAAARAGQAQTAAGIAEAGFDPSTPPAPASTPSLGNFLSNALTGGLVTTEGIRAERASARASAAAPTSAQATTSQAAAPQPATPARPAAPASEQAPAPTVQASQTPAPTAATPRTPPASRASQPDRSGRVLRGTENGVRSYGDAAGLSGSPNFVAEGSFNPRPASGMLPPAGAPTPEYWRQQLQQVQMRENQAYSEKMAGRAQDAAQRAMNDTTKRQEQLIAQIDRAHMMGRPKLAADLTKALAEVGRTGAAQAQQLYAPGSDQLKAGVQVRGQDVAADTAAQDTAVKREGVQAQYGLGMRRIATDERAQNMQAETAAARLLAEQQGQNLQYFLGKQQVDATLRGQDVQERIANTKTTPKYDYFPTMEPGVFLRSDGVVIDATADILAARKQLKAAGR